jgi:hypothetical protein
MEFSHRLLKPLLERSCPKYLSGENSGWKEAQGLKPRSLLDPVRPD